MPKGSSNPHDVSFEYTLMAAGTRTFASAFGSVALARRPDVPDGSLLAWDAADELLLSAFDSARETLRVERPRVLVVSDTFGALSTALVGSGVAEVTMWSDSQVSFAAMRSNLERNGHRIESVACVASTTTISEAFDIVLWRLPHDRSYLRHQIDVLARAMRGAVVVAGGMDKYLAPAVRDDLGLLGDASMRRGQKKAHLFDVRVETVEPNASLARQGFGADIGLDLVGAPNVFGGDGLDLGARVLLEAITGSPLEGFERIADLGCGSGVLGITLGRRLPDAEVVFFDESFLAVESARHNARANDVDRTTFIAADGFAGYTDEPFDLIVCNPPFHQRGAVSDAVAFSLMRQAHHHLVTGGELWVVGNRHLGYHLKMQRLFGNCHQLAAHPKFVVVAGVRKTARLRAPVRFPS